MEKGTPTLGSLHLFETEAAIACHPCNFPVPSIPSPTGGFKVSLGGARFFGPQDALESTQHSGIVQHTARISMVCMVQCGM